MFEYVDTILLLFNKSALDSHSSYNVLTSCLQILWQGSVANSEVYGNVEERVQKTFETWYP